MGQQLNKAYRHFTQIALSVIFPPVCLGCGVQVSQNGVVCADCWPQLSLISRPFCPIMGTPLPYDAGNGDEGEAFFSAEALHDPPPFDAARSVALHHGLAQNLVTRLKYGQHTELAIWMADWMFRAAVDFFDKVPLIIPVPLHRFRFWQRGYNQSAELARALAIRAKNKNCFFPEGLRRKKWTRQQVGLSAKERKANMRAAFEVPAQAYSQIRDQSIVLVDDVFTTGATVRAAALTLREAGAASIYVVTFSRALL